VARQVAAAVGNATSRNAAIMDLKFESQSNNYDESNVKRVGLWVCTDGLAQVAVTGGDGLIDRGVQLSRRFRRSFRKTDKTPPPLSKFNFVDLLLNSM
jgi:hypothetical protein